jgi:GPH family glycoside/pentoside/hexuronide:cation symporter
MTEFNLKDQLEDKLSPKMKIAYGSTNMAHFALSNIAFTAITFYYNVKLGLDALLIGIGWLIFAIWNALNDPLFGFLEDKTKSKKYGRRIPYVRFLAPLHGILFLLFWFPLVDLNNELALFFNFLLILLAYDTVLTMTAIALYALPAEMAISSKERSSIMVYDTIIGAFGSGIAFILPVFLLTGGSDSGQLNIGFYIIMVILAIVFSLIMFIGSYFLKENRYTVLEDSLGLIDGVKETFRNRAFIHFSIANFAFIVAMTTLTTAVFYYVDFVLELSGPVTIVPILAVYITAIAFSIAVIPMVDKYGVKKVYLIGLIWMGLGFIIFLLTGWILITAIITLLFLGAGISILFVTGPTILSDIIDYDETRTAKRRETTYSGINALIAKPAVSLANWLFLLIITSYGFQPLAQFQTNSAKLGIMIAITVIPALSLFIGAFIMKFYPLQGSDWESKKLEIVKIHAEKEKAFLEYLKENKN